MQQNDTIAFTGVMDLDTDPRYLANGNYPYAENIRCGYSEGRAMGAVENILGALLIPNNVVPANGRYKCIGATQDRMNNYLYYYICDTQGTDHGIYRYNYLTGTIITVYKDPSLNFKLTNRIKSSGTVNNTLYWWDDLNENAQLYTIDAVAGKYTGGLLDYITLGRRQPSQPIVCSLPTTGYTQVFTDTLSFQFIYRYVFVNGQKSRWSCPSKLYSTGYDSVLPTRKGVAITIQNNETSNADRYSSIISFIDVGFRTSDITGYSFYRRFVFPNTVNSTIQDVFYNDKAYPKIDSADLVNNYDNIPLHSKTGVIAENRHLSANNTYGESTPEFRITNVSFPTISSPTLDTTHLNTGGRYGLCMLFYDWLGRCNGAVPLDGSVFANTVSVAVPSRNGAFQPQGISFNISGICPSWVSYYRIGITKIRNKGKFVEAFVTVISSDANNLVFSANFASPTPSTIAWIYSTGDRASIKAANVDSSSCSSTFDDMPLTYNASTAQAQFTLSKKGINLDNLMGKTPLIEFFTPILGAATEEFYYEIPDTYVPSIDSSGILRYGLDINGNQKSIVITEGYGDTHYRKYTGNTTMAIAIEAMSANDKYYETWQHGIGRGWIVPPSIPSQYTDTKNIAFSDPFIPNGDASTQSLSLAVNGLNAYNPFNQSQLPVELGDIQKLILTIDYQANGGVMLCITSTKSVAYYLNKTRFLGANGNTVFGLSDQFINTPNPLQEDAGTLNPESVVVYDGKVYWWDVLRGIIWRYGQNGLFAISQKYGAKAYTNAVGASALKNRNDPNQICPAFFDSYYMEYGVYLNDISSTTSKILAFNEDKNGFSTFYTWIPEWAESINQYVCSFNNGQLYVHRLGTPNVVYGQKVVSKIGFTSNSMPNDNKIYQSVAIEAQDHWIPSLLKTQDNTRGDNPSTYSAQLDSEEKEWDFYFAIMRSLPDRQNGNKDIRGKYLYGELTLQDVNYITRLYGVDVSYRMSQIIKEKR